MRWTSEQYAAYEARNKTPCPKPQCPVRHGPLATSKGKESHPTSRPRRIAIKIVSFRTRLLDPDNLVGGVKYFIDSLRYAALIPDDRPQDITLEVSQEKVQTRKEERTTIEIL